MLSHLLNKTCSLLQPSSSFNSIIRQASKKAGGSTRNRKNHGKPKHYGIKVNDGQFVTPGTMLVKQRTLRYHPGLHAGLGINGCLFAIEAGKVVITGEKTDLDWDHSWVQRSYSGRQNQEFYKKYIHVIPPQQKGVFKLIDQI